MSTPSTCLWCEEKIVPGDLQHALLPGFHYACAVRQVLGSIDHVSGVCDGACSDPPELTKRQAARLVADYVNPRIKKEPACPTT